MKIIITGGAGFIGSNLGLYLIQKGHEVCFVDNLSFGYKENIFLANRKSFAKINFLKIDVRDKHIKNVLKRTDVVFHFAAISSLPECQYNPQEAYDVNVVGTINVLEAARQHNIKRVIFSSTAGVYENERTFPTPTGIDVHPTLIYSLSKKHAEEVCLSYQQLYGMDIVIFRFFNVYGPHMDFQRANPPVVSYIIKHLQNRQQPILRSDGNQKRDMVYIDDVVRLCELALTNKKAKNQTLNVGSGRSYTIKNLYKEIASQMGIHNISPIYYRADTLWDNYPPLFEGPFPFQKNFIEKEVNKRTLASIEQTKKILKWMPKVDLHDGLKRTIQQANK